jgi:hypothetical protein
VGAAYDAYDKQQESARKQAARYRALTAQIEDAEALTRVARARLRRVEDRWHSVGNQRARYEADDPAVVGLDEGAGGNHATR